MTIKGIIRHVRNGTFQQRIEEKKEEELPVLIKKYYQHMPIYKRKIVFDNFSGKGFADHPRYIAEEIHRRGIHWDMVWLVRDMDEPMPEYIRKVCYRSWRSLYELATAKMWVDNVRNAHLLPKRKKQVYLQTWHGSFPSKLVEKEVEDILSLEYVKNAKYDGSIIDGIISCNSLQTERYKQSFWLNRDTEILEIGGPRLDCLYDPEYSVNVNQALRAQFGFDIYDFLVLYAPTFRDNGDTNVYRLQYLTIKEAFEKKTGRKCRILIRLHPNITEKNILDYNDDLVDVSGIPDVNECIAFCDALITDFSDVFYEASILGKPCFRYAEDYDEYLKIRPVNPIMEQVPIPISKTIGEFLISVEEMDFKENVRHTRDFLDRIGTYGGGRSAELAVEWLEKKVKQ